MTFLQFLLILNQSITLEITVTERKVIIPREMEMRLVNLAKRSYGTTKL